MKSTIQLHAIAPMMVLALLCACSCSNEVADNEGVSGISLSESAGTRDSGQQPRPKNNGSAVSNGNSPNSDVVEASSSGASPTSNASSAISTKRSKKGATSLVGKRPVANKPAAKTPLKIQVVKGKQAGDFDIYVTNTGKEAITKCKVQLFPGVMIDVARNIGPGQVAMCGVGGELPKTIAFSAEQFDAFDFQFPEDPLESMDVSAFEWADMDNSGAPIEDVIISEELALETSREERSPRVRPKSGRDLLDFGDDDPKQDEAKEESRKQGNSRSK